MSLSFFPPPAMLGLGSAKLLLIGTLCGATYAEVASITLGDADQADQHSRKGGAL